MQAEYLAIVMNYELPCYWHMVTSHEYSLLISEMGLTRPWVIIIKGLKCAGLTGEVLEATVWRPGRLLVITINTNKFGLVKVG